MSNSSSRSGFTSALLLLTALLIIVIASILQLAPPSVAPAGAPADEFSAERAMHHVQAMDIGPHWTGSEGNAQIRDYLVEQLQAIGLETDVQSADVVQPEYLTAARVENVIARLPGSDGSKAILFVVHYDSVASGPGASYHAFNATLLETARALAANPQLKNDVIFLFTDAEEWGFLGAKAFIEEHPWMPKIALVVEGIPRGNGGPVFLGTTSENNTWLMNQFINTVPYPVAHSFARDAYAQIPGGGDFEEFDKNGIPGMLLTWEKGQVTYHAATDSVAHLNPKSIQHLGSYFLSIARHFGNLDLDQIQQKNNLTFFNLLNHVVIRYPNALVIPFNIAAIVFLIATLVIGYRRSHLSLKQSALGFGTFLLVLIATQILAMLIWFLVSLTNPPTIGMVAKIPYNAGIYTFAFIASAIALFTTMFLRLRNKIGAHNLAAGALIWWMLLTLISALALQGGNYMFLWSLVFGTASLLYRMRADTNQPKDALILSILAAPALLILVPVFYLMYISLVWITGVPGMIPILTALTLGLLFPHFDLLTHASSRRSWLVAVSSGIALSLIILGLTTQQTDANQPLDIHLVYGLDTDTNSAYWFTNDSNNPWTKQVFTGASEAGNFNIEFYGSDGLQETTNFVRTNAPVADLPAPSVEVMNDNPSLNTRTLILRITSPRGATMFNVFASPDTKILSAKLNGKDFYDGESTFNVPYWGAPREGIELTLIVPASQAVTLIVSDLTPGFPQLDRVAITPRPTGWIMPPNGGYYFSDSTWVKKTFTFGKGQ